MLGLMFRLIAIVLSCVVFWSSVSWAQSGLSEQREPVANEAANGTTDDSMDTNVATDATNDTVDEPVLRVPDAKPPAAEEALVDTLERAGTAVVAISELSERLGAGRFSRDAAALGRALQMGSDYVELASLLARSNRPTSMTWQASLSVSAGQQKAPTESFAGDLSLSFGLVITGPTCNLLDLGGQLTASSPQGVSLTQFGFACLGGFVPDDEPSVELVRLSAYETAGLNVRPAVSAAAVVGSARYSTFDVGLEGEGINWEYKRGKRSLGLLKVGLGWGWLKQTIVGDERSIITSSADAWIVEWRFLRPPRALTDTIFRFLTIGFDSITSGEAVGVLEGKPLEVVGLGYGGVYVDAAWGGALTAEEVDDNGQPLNDSELPNVASVIWRLAAYVGSRWFHVGLSRQQQLIPTLTSDLVIERRTRLWAHFDRGRLYIDASVFTADNDIYIDLDDTVDRQDDTWGLDAVVSIRATDRISVGAWLETGESFYFAPSGNDLDELPEPMSGWRALLTFTYGDSSSSRL